MTLWQIDIYPADGRADRAAADVLADAAYLGAPGELDVCSAYGYLIEGDVSSEQAGQLATEMLADAVVQRHVTAPVGDPLLAQPPAGQAQKNPHLVYVIPKPGVMDPVAQSALAAIRGSGVDASAVRTFRKFWISHLDETALRRLADRLLANDVIEQVVVGPLHLSKLDVGSGQSFELRHMPILDLDDDGLTRLSREGQLYLTLPEMQTIQRHFRELGREPTDVELETLAQTWSEHCSHKTLAGRIAYRDEQGERRFENMLKETIFAATQQIRRELGSDDWCVSVFEDNAGVVRFDEQWNVAFKVETHNHPSALEPYGGANTGLGGVIRDTLGTGLGAKPLCSTDVFCFAPPDTAPDSLPPGVLHPRKVIKGVVSGVRDYGNRMGIPTVNGAVYFDPRYLGNPLVYCGNVGLIPHAKSHKQPQASDFAVAIGGRTGRDGIHGATFSSAELTHESESVSGGAVQIGNAITEKIVLDVLLAARDRNLFNAVTDCGAGGFSSAVGEMGEKIGAEVWLEKAPLKYEGLTYCEIWISEAQERMVLSVPPDKLDEFNQLCAAYGVESAVIGQFKPTGKLQLTYDGADVGELSMTFLHDGRPPVVREAVYQPPPQTAWSASPKTSDDWSGALLRILGSPNVASKEWVIRQYDHEVQGGSVIKPLVGAGNDGPGDAAVIRPVLSSYRGLAVSCGMNPRYGEFDTYLMAASAIDEAIRNSVAVGADPARIAILDNFCWGYTDRPETLGSLVRAALACHDLAVALKTPFISGKDSLNNEFSFEDEQGRRQTISIPPSLLISAIGQIDDVRQCVTMDLKAPGNLLYLVGVTRDEMGGSHYSLVEGASGGAAPIVDPEQAKRLFEAVHRAIFSGVVRSCHDLSEGGLAVAAAEMAFAGAVGASIQLDRLVHEIAEADVGRKIASLLFSESNTRFMCEVTPDNRSAFESTLSGVPHACIGETTGASRLWVTGFGEDLIDEEIMTLKKAWQAPLRKL